jgi:hypothetical protein
MADAEAGPGLGVDARLTLSAALVMARADGRYVVPSGDVAALNALLNAITPHVAALLSDEAAVAAQLAQARADGEEVGRGDMAHFEELWRADEREKSAARIAAGHDRWAEDGGEEYLRGLRAAEILVRQETWQQGAARIARERDAARIERERDQR